MAVSMLYKATQVMTPPRINARKIQIALRLGLILVTLGQICSCSGLQQVGQTPAPPTVNLAERSLLEMDFDEAKAISAQSTQVGSLFRVAADHVEILKTDRQGQPTKVRATGHVFVDMALTERATALCEEAILTRGDVTLKGQPMVKRGNRVAKSKNASTTFWITEARLHATGSCELAQLEALPAPMTMLMASNDFFPIPEPMLPPTTEPWVANAENVLLPALPGASFPGN